MNLPVPQRLALLAGEAEQLFPLIGEEYEDEDAAGDRVAEFIFACNAAAMAYPQPDAMELKYSSLSPKAIKQAKHRRRNERKRAKKARKANR